MLSTGIETPSLMSEVVETQKPCWDSVLVQNCHALIMALMWLNRAITTAAVAVALAMSVAALWPLGRALMPAMNKMQCSAYMHEPPLKN